MLYCIWKSTNNISLHSHEREALAPRGAFVNAYGYKGYVRVARLWQTGDSVVLSLDMPVQRVWAHPDVRDDSGYVALQRGPLVYCLEGVDNAVPLNHIRLSKEANFESYFDPTLLRGVTVIRGEGSALETGDWDGVLYRTTPPSRRPYSFVAIPYYAWDNRQPGEMRVWIQTDA